MELTLGAIQGPVAYCTVAASSHLSDKLNIIVYNLHGLHPDPDTITICTQLSDMVDNCYITGCRDGLGIVKYVNKTWLEANQDTSQKQENDT